MNPNDSMSKSHIIIYKQTKCGIGWLDRRLKNVFVYDNLCVDIGLLDNVRNGHWYINEKKQRK